ncbi:MAG: NADH-quinone oxidoreductase subunit N [Verrucomicrobia bacterium]|nr:NADH-quinone oxidoreductase subunit N [Verrucomicrobiota bacterium]
MNPFSYLEALRLAAPETALAVAALAVLFADLGGMRGESLRHRAILGAGITAVGGAMALLWLGFAPGYGTIAEGVLVTSPLTQLVKAGLVLLTLLVAGLSLDPRFTGHVGEYFSLLLLGTIGMMVLVSTQDLLMLFLALELTSLPLYVLAGFNKRDRASAEAALKYFFFGSVAAAFLLFGFSLLYGVAGSTRLPVIAAAVALKPPDALTLVALVCVVMGFGFKVAAVPFHLWAPDAYEGAPTPAAAFIASGSKVASFAVFGIVLAQGLGPMAGGADWHGFTTGWLPLLAVVALASMLLGNLAAIAQRSVKRLLAYSAIAHAGYLLLGLMALATPANRPAALAAILYYAITYALSTVGAFGIVAVVERATGSDAADGFNGLARRSPALALCLMIFLLSLAGIPPLAGFLGKFYVFVAATRAGDGSLSLFWLVLVAIALSVVSLYYYLKLLKRAYVLPPDGAVPATRPDVMEFVVIGMTAAAVLGLGVFPRALLEPLALAIQQAGF